MADRDEMISHLAADLFDWGQRPNRSTDDVKAMLAPFLAAWTAAEPVKVPGPYEIAMLYGAALTASGRVDNVAAAMMQGWAAVPEFYKARDWYLTDFVPMRMGLAVSPAEGSGDANETSDN